MLQVVQREWALDQQVMGLGPPASNKDEVSIKAGNHATSKWLSWNDHILSDTLDLLPGLLAASRYMKE